MISRARANALATMADNEETSTSRTKKLKRGPTKKRGQMKKKKGAMKKNKPSILSKIAQSNR